MCMFPNCDYCLQQHPQHTPGDCPVRRCGLPYARCISDYKDFPFNGPRLVTWNNYSEDGRDE
jgi:hypothetical protein